MFPILHLLLLQELLEEEEEANRRKRRRKFLVNQQVDRAMELTDADFLDYYRISKEMFNEILNLTEDTLLDSSEAAGYSKEIQVLVVLDWLAHGQVQGVVKPGTPIETSKSTPCKIIKKVLTILENKLGNAFIQWPQKLSERKRIKEGFYAKCGIPSTIGIIDCAHVEIQKPPKAHLCLNQYDKYSLNVALICDHEGKFIAVDATYGGATHNSEIWNMSRERSFMQKIYTEFHEKCWLLANTAYPLEPWLISPYRSASQEDIEFNKKFSAVRSVMSHNVALLRSRWGILTHTVPCTPQKTVTVINLCIALHNMCNMTDIPDAVVDPKVQKMQEEEEIVEVDETGNEIDEDDAEDLKDKGAANRDALKHILG